MNICRSATSRTVVLAVTLLALPSVARAQSDREIPRDSSRRPAALLPLYGSFAIMQALDIHSTISVLDRGTGHEANPVMAMAIGSPAAAIAIKASMTAAVIVACERMRENHHGVAAVLVMIGANSAYAMIAAHNYAIAGR